MRKLFVILAAISLASVAIAAFDVVDPQGKKIGSATQTSANSNGRLVWSMVVSVAQDNAKVVVSVRSVFTPSGDPVSSTFRLKSTSQGSAVTVDTKVTFSGRKATLVSTTLGKKDTKTLVAPGSVRDLTRVWATGKVPALGTKVTYYQLDASNSRFNKHTDTYHGLRSITAGGKRVSAHVIVAKGPNGTTKEYFTSKGELLRLDTRDFSIVKR